MLLAAHLALPMGLAVLLSLAATCALTGALHEDGLADTFDGIGGRDREAALEIMRDSRIGVYGALALGLTLAIKVAALAAMPAGVAAAALVAGHAASRFSVVGVIATSRYVRAAGTGGFTAAGLAPDGVAVAAATAALALAVLAAVGGPGAALAGAGGIAVGHLLARRLFEPRLGGYTGDCLGATQQLGEVGLLRRGAGMSLTLLRHARPLGAEGVCYGISDLAAPPLAAAEADALAARLGPAERIVSSPLARCLPLAEALGARLGVPVSVDARWREIDFGSWEGRRWDAIPRAELDAWAADFLDARPHGGESVAMLLARTRAALAAGAPGERRVAVTHAGVIRAALFATDGGSAAWSREVPFGELVELGAVPA